MLRLEQVINARNISKVHFSLRNDYLRLLRIEDNQVKLVQNEYVYPKHEIFIPPASKSAEEWVALLTFRDTGDVLSALSFLGGRHLDESTHPSADLPRQSKYANSLRQVLADPRIQDQIQQLRRSKNEWVRQVATFAGRFRPEEHPA